MDSRDGFILESNFTQDDLTFHGVRQLYHFERLLCGATGKRQPIDFNKLRPYFLWKPIDTIKKTFSVTTQFMETVWYNTPRLMPRTLLNFIRQWGAMKFLWRDMAKEENSKTVNDLLRSIHAPNRYSEPYNEHQNPAERRILDIKSSTRTVLDRTGTPDKWWLLCMTYVTFIMNHIALASLNWQTPYFSAFGITRDISPLLLYQW